MLCGIVCEYNPFHMGHQKQIRWLKEQGHQVICVMSASFVQRGEPAIYDKWSRTRWALNAGADVVIELPVIYSLQSAQGFARGAVALLRAANVDAICFGCEHADKGHLFAAAKLQAHPTEEYQALLKNALNSGVSYPQAMEHATRTILPCLPEDFFSPNNLLAIEYFKAMMEQNWSPEILPFPRLSDGYTAGRCRAEILSGSVPENLLPRFVISDLRYLTPLSVDALTPLLLFYLRTMDRDRLSQIVDVTEGLENRILAAAADSVDLDSLLTQCSGKRYTRARIKRILCAALLDIKKADLAAYRQNPPYLRVLGFQKSSANLIGTIAKDTTVPFVDSIQTIRSHPVFMKELRATELRGAFTGDRSGRDFSEPIMIL